MQIIHGDCLEKMKDIPDKSIDMILCDLPYGTTACKWDVVIPFNKYVQIGEKVIYEQEYVFDKMKSGVSYKEALEDFLSISKDGLWEQYKRIIKNRGAIVLFGSEPFSSYLRMSNIKQYRYDWVWDKGKGTNPFLAKKQPMRSYENIMVFNSGVYYPQMREGTPYKGRRTGGAHTNSIVGNNKEQGDFKQKDNDGTRYPLAILPYSIHCGSKLHPTQKPVALLEYLIKTYTLEGETVLDNCMGSGSTGIACINTKRNFIGIEKDDKYFEIASKRIADTVKDASTMLF